MMNMLFYMFGMREKVVLQVTMVSCIADYINSKDPKFKGIILMSNDCGYQNRKYMP